jgi:cysteine-rich repeat protein
MLRAAVYGIWMSMALFAFGCSGATGPPSGDESPGIDLCGPEAACPMGLICVDGGCELAETHAANGLTADTSTGAEVADAGDDAQERTSADTAGPADPPGEDPCEGVDCPDGSTCQSSPGAEGVETAACIPDQGPLCEPCQSDADCGDAACVDYSGQGRFCGANCAEDADCPAGFSCDAGEDGQSGQCVDVDGVCECSEAAIATGRGAGCSVSNELGTCEGIRVCGVDGLAACDALVPSPESCNGVDDNCDGVTDDTLCEDDNPCTTDSCAGEAGCAFEPTPGVPCDDGDVATANDLCATEGTCTGEPIVCPTGPCVHDAAPDGVTCKAAYLVEGASCDDGDGATEGDACTADGVCVGTPYACEPGLCELSAAPGDGGCEVVYQAQGTFCDDGDLNTSQDNCDGSGTCKGTLLDCPAESVCVLSSVANGSGCDVVYAEDGTACDDGVLETGGDRCDGAGTCKGTGYACIPGPCELKSIANGVDCDIVMAAVDSACDDGADDTEGDSCDASGACVGTPYVCAVGPCAVSSVPNGVDCDVVPVEVGTACDDLVDTTQGDACDTAGECVGEPYVCVLGPCDVSSEPDGEGCVVIPVALGALCDDGDATTKGDVCDGGSLCAGAPYACEPAQCEASSVPNGVDCDVLAVNAGVGCDDDDLGTSADVCDGFGGCLGVSLSCEASACEVTSEPNGVTCVATFMETGEACDDGVEETNDDACDGAGVCAGELTSCVPSECEVSSTGNVGACEVVYEDSGVSCDDGDLATGADSCDGTGVCVGEPLACEPSLCELFSAPDGEACDVTFAAEGAACNDDEVATVQDSCDGAGGCLGIAPTCGDGVLEGLEACEPEEGASLSCIYGETACEVCLDCQWEPGVVVGSCGDGVVQSEFEACDDGNAAVGDGCTPNCTTEPMGPSMTVGGTVSSWTQGGTFRGNVFDWKEAKTLQSFDVYLTFPSSCALGLFVHEVHGNTKTVIWSATFNHPSSAGFINSGHVGLPLEAGARYGLGVGWTCAAGYYGTNAFCDDYGVMQGVVSYWDNSYGGYSPDYTPPNQGAGCSIVYHQNFYFN